MTPRVAFVFTYALMAEEAGGRKEIEELLEKWATDNDFTRARYRPEAEVPDTIAKDMLGLMALAPPAPRKAD